MNLAQRTAASSLLAFAAVAAVVLFAVTGPARAQQDCIRLFVAGTQDCALLDDTGLITLSVIHEPVTGAVASQYRVAQWPCGTLAFIADVVPFALNIGNSQTGIAMSYGACLTDPIHVQDVLYAGTGTSGTDCPIRVVGSTNVPSGEIEVVDCGNNTAAALGGTLWIKPTSPVSCDCAPPPEVPTLTVVPNLIDLGETDNYGTFSIDNIGGGTLEWTVDSSAPWVNEVPDSGVGPATVTVIADRSGLPVGQHSALVQVMSNGGNATVEVRLAVVEAPDPQIQVQPTTLNFTSGVSTLPLYIVSLTSADLNWSVFPSVSWVAVAPTSGTGSADLQVAVDRAGLAEGTHTASILVASNATNVPNGDVNVTVNVTVGGTPGTQGVVTLYADSSLSECNLANDLDLVTVFVVHQLTDGATAAQYKLENNGHTMVFIGDQNQFPLTIGSSQTGISVAYGSCLQAPILIQRVLYLGAGTSPVCSAIDVVADPSAPSGRIEAVDCSSTKFYPAGGHLSIKDNGSCPCLVPVKAATWGTIRALFRGDVKEKTKD